MSLTAPVSVVIPCYRCVSTIRRAVESVASQTWRPEEIVVIDDCSQDGTLEMLRQLAQEHPVGWMKVVALDSNCGPATARNIGWNLATQQFVAFLDSDDRWHPDKVRLQARWMILNPQVALTCHALPLSRAESTVLPDEANFFDISTWRLLLSNRMLTPTVMVQRSIPNRFPDGRRYSEDYFLWLNIRLDGMACGYSPEQMAFRHKGSFGDSGLSARLWQMERGELQNFAALHADRKIGAATCGVVMAVSLLKFARRVLLSFGSNALRFLQHRFV